MLDIGWSELMIIGVIALVVVGPKDLPRVLRYAGYWMGKARSMAREFQKAIDQYAKEAEVDDIKKVAEAPFRAKSAIKNAIDPKGAIKKQLTETETSVRNDLKDTATGGPAKANGKVELADATPAAASSSGAATPAQAVTEAAVAEDKPKAQAG